MPLHLVAQGVFVAMAISPKNTPVSKIPLDLELHEFLIDRQARNLARKTLQWYEHSLNIFAEFLRSQEIHATVAILPGHIRRFLLRLAEQGHNAGGVANIFGAVKAYLRWYEVEYAPAGWQNPLKRIKTPKRGDEPLEPLSLEHLQAMLATCERKTFTGDRDRAILLSLVDSGVRHQELTDLMIGDVDFSTGAVLIRQGKGRKSRTVFIGAKTKRALLAYLRHRSRYRDDQPLWLTRAGDRLTRDGIKEVVRRRAKMAGIPMPGLHKFRRAFAVNSLRNGMDIVSLQRLMGHSSLAIITKYLKLVTQDLQTAHARFGVVDRL